MAIKTVFIITGVVGIVVILAIGLGLGLGLKSDGIETTESPVTTKSSTTIASTTTGSTTIASTTTASTTTASTNIASTTSSSSAKPYVPQEYDWEISLGDNDLDQYVKSTDGTTSYKHLTQFTINGPGFQKFVLNFTSQTDQLEGRPLIHELFIHIPVNEDGIFQIDQNMPKILQLEGGNVDDILSPDYHPEDLGDKMKISQFASGDLMTVTAVLKQVPSSSFYSMNETTKVAFGQAEFLKSGNFLSLLEFTATKAVSESLKIIDSFVLTQTNIDISKQKFAITGQNFQAKIAYLTAAVNYDKVSNLFLEAFTAFRMNKWLHKQIINLGGFSYYWKDYVDQGVFGYIDTAEYDELSKIVDPWSYRSRFAEKGILVHRVLSLSSLFQYFQQKMRKHRHKSPIIIFILFRLICK